MEHHSPIKCSSPELTSVLSIPSSLARTGHMTLPNDKGAGSETLPCAGLNAERTLALDGISEMIKFNKRKHREEKRIAHSHTAG